jgi:hypothetical protein
MIKNFHFKMLIGISIFAFVIGFVYLASGLRNHSDRVGTPIGGLFCAFGLFAAITAGAIRSIHRRLDQAGIAEDPQYPSSGVVATDPASPAPADPTKPRRGV